MFKRVIIKLSGEALAGESSESYDNPTVDRIVREIKKVIDNRTQVMLVVGGGNIWRGRSADSQMNRSKADQIGMLATIMNAMYLTEAFKKYSIKASVMTPFKVGTMTYEYSVEKAEDYLEKGNVLIFAGGTGHPFFSTDTIAAIRAAELSCDCILYAKNIDGIYNSDPNVNKDAVRFKTISYKEIIEKNLKAIDLTAMTLCWENNIPSIAFDLRKDGSILLSSKNNDEVFEIGTKIIC